MPLRSRASLSQNGATLPATAALRGDIAALSQRTSAEPPEWFLTASLLEHAAWQVGPSRRVALQQALELARGFIADELLDRLADDEWPAERGDCDLVLVLADQMEHGGYLRRAACSLDALASSDLNLSPVQSGRAQAQRSGIAVKQGNLDEARNRFALLEKLERAADSDELKARAAVGLGALAQARGNYPELRRLCRRALKFARRARVRSLLRHAHAGLMISAAIAGDLDGALEHGWEMYCGSVGDPGLEVEVLQNLGQALLDAGQPALARAAFGIVV